VHQDVAQQARREGFRLMVVELVTDFTPVAEIPLPSTDRERVFDPSQLSVVAIDETSVVMDGEFQN
jgi:hypothetical protein